MGFEHVRKTGGASPVEFHPGGLAGWLLKRLRGAGRVWRKDAPKLALVERITLAPRQTLSLVEAEGRRFLVASSAEGAPAFYPLHGGVQRPRGVKARVSW